MSELHFEIPEQFVEAIVERVTERVLTSLGGDGRSPWMSTEECAEYLRWSPRRIYKLSAAGAIPHRKHQGRILFHREEIDRWLDRFREGRA